MAKTKKNKKTYKDLIKEIEFLESIIIYYREYLERIGVLIENYIEMNVLCLPCYPRYDRLDAMGKKWLENEYMSGTSEQERYGKGD